MVGRRSLIHALAACFLATTATAGDVQTALNDRASFPREDWPYLYYLSLEHLHGQERIDCAIAVRLVVASCSLQPLIERCRPVSISRTLARIDLRDLQWEHDDWAVVLKDYPYQQLKDKQLPLVVRADWLVIRLADAQESDSYYRLLFGGDRIPETRDQFLEQLGASTLAGLDDERYFNVGLVEGQSRVSKQLVRWIENRPVLRGYVWGTRDTLQLDQERDPLENLSGEYQHDGEEWIVGTMKRSIRTGKTGVLQVYLLSNGQGGRVDRAPVDLVEDATEFRGYREIRTCGSCIQCHSKGLNDFTKHEVRNLIKSGADIYVKGKEDQIAIEAFHLADLQRELERNNEDYAIGVEMACGQEPEAASIAFKATVDAYDRPLDLERAANESYATDRELKMALALASEKGSRLPARLAGLVHGGTVSRDAWEDHALQVRYYLRVWRN